MFWWAKATQPDRWPDGVTKTPGGQKGAWHSVRFCSMSSSKPGHPYVVDAVAACSPVECVVRGKVCVFRGSSTVGCDGEIVDAGGVAGEEADRTAGRHLLATSG